MLGKVILALGLILVASCGVLGDECVNHTDCVNSDASKKAGRCGPESWCEDRRCRAECKKLCATVSSESNACPTALICMQSRKSDPVVAPTFCTRLQIPCTTVDDCPIYRPAGGDGNQQVWTCEGQVCRYPGLTYPVEGG